MTISKEKKSEKELNMEKKPTKEEIKSEKELIQESHVDFDNELARLDEELL